MALAALHRALPVVSARGAIMPCSCTRPRRLQAGVVLVNGVEAWVESGAVRTPITTQRYTPDILFPDIAKRITSFSHNPWPSWTFTLEDGTTLRHDIVVEPDSCKTCLHWQHESGTTPCRLMVRLLLSGRDYHALHRENPYFRFDHTISGGNVAWHPYPDLPAVTALTNGAFTPAPDWYRNFLYTAERDRGLDDVEDLASPGIFTFDLSANASASIVLRAGNDLSPIMPDHAAALLSAEGTRRSAPALARAAGSYLVQRGSGRTLIAGFPWFTDWGRDTFIAMRGLVLANGDLDAARDILLAWSCLVSEGMLPNRFPDKGGTPEYNAVDASLWYIVAVHEFLALCPASDAGATMRAACEAILEGFTHGTRFGIRADSDGLLAAGVPGEQLTWMDARIGDHVITPRIGKPVEIQALWINALLIGAARWSEKWQAAADRALLAFRARFPLPGGGLLDVVDVEHRPGTADASLRPNQIFAVGGLPFRLLEGKAAREVVDLVEAELLTPLGLRTLSPANPAYRGHYAGDPAARDGAYHQGTAWPWLMGAFVDAWLNVRERTEAAKAEARSRFLAPLMAHLEEAGLGHVSEVADGDPPHTPGGCPFQAWSLGELTRIRRMLDLET